MDAVFDAHYRIMQDEFALRGISLEIAYTPNGEPDYIYERGRLNASGFKAERLRVGSVPSRAV